ncbi:MAG: type II toxin-antitoxin system Phd/YefM family antitoxin [Candidatus Aminicenantes bacterium]|nr:type II toxin-antitoxin system Phd/YefM family antitoxin [Candidatus Aminicenantes bacterium]
MPIQTTYTNARAEFARLWDEVTNNLEVVIIKRRGAEDVALISASELKGLLETSHLLRSPKNAERLLAAYERAMTKKGEPQSVNQLRKEVGFE